MFVADGGECLAAQSYAKNMGLYGERIGALSIVRKSIPMHLFFIYCVGFTYHPCKLMVDFLFE